MNVFFGILRRTEPFLMQPAATREEAWPGSLTERLIPERGLFESLSPNRTGLAMLRESKGTYSEFDGACRSSLAILRSTAVCIALRRWQRSHADGLPADLSELVPDYLDAVPEDPFDGQPLRWDRAAGVAYSIGSDWKDNSPVFQAPSYDKTRPVGRFANESASPGVRLLFPPAAPAGISPPTTLPDGGRDR